jgi:multidrug transporter EmrE-like cation transporter
MQGWLVLAAAILCEVVATMMMELSHSVSQERGYCSDSLLAVSTFLLSQRGDTEARRKEERRNTKYTNS